MAPRISPHKDAMHHVMTKTDKTRKLEVKFINAIKGRGVFATHSFNKGDFVVEYRGDMITGEECERRKRVYHHSCAAFMFAFRWKEKMWCIDASREDGSFGRFVNDDHRRPNCKMKKIDVNGEPHLCLFALHNIGVGEEITYDYGGNDCPWRTKSPTDGIHMVAVEEANPLTLPEIQTENASEPISSGLQSPTDGIHMVAVEEANPLTLPEIQTENASEPISSGLQSPTDGIHMVAVEEANPLTLPEIQTENTSEPISSGLQSPTDGIHMVAVEEANPLTLPDIQTENTSEPIISGLQSPTDGIHMVAVEEANPLTLPDIQTENASEPISSGLQSPTDGIHMVAVEEANPLTLPEIQTENASEPISSGLQSPTDGIHMVAVEEANPLTLPDIQTENTSEPIISGLQSPTDGIHMVAVEEANPLTLPEIQTENASEPISSGLQLFTVPVHEEIVIPRLRRTKSVIMKDLNLEDAKLFDSTSESSDNYIPETSESDTDSDSSYRPSARESKPYAKMARHLERAHIKKCDVAKAFSFPKGSRERKKNLDYIRNKGNFAHNAAVMEAGSGKLVASKRPSAQIQVLNMTDTEMDQLANFLGHDIRIHREFYRLPEKTLQLAKVSKVLMALEQGRLAEFQGKNLDEIGIDPDDEVPITEDDGGTNEENYLSAVDEEDGCVEAKDLSAVEEPTAECSLASSDRNEGSPPQPKRSRGPSIDKSVSAPKSLKGKVDNKKKTPWTQTEIQAVDRQMSTFIRSCRVPGKTDCEKCLASEPEALKHRDWQHLKFYVYNRITAYKRKFQCQ
ncbi:hypothetical protein OJAV_G00135680 [Oryzias javanicus]|uniref:SET domain-containing protein n=1 Tax=Oryzias javanicus TaxID=123683 RepID=A0A437CLR8_ORYJA|nr:hypothetical protein OJAV_G00135680 [Oryzias javanicus]